jgi:hypothetical protein
MRRLRLPLRYRERARQSQDQEIVRVQRSILRFRCGQWPLY